MVPGVAPNRGLLAFVTVLLAATFLGVAQVQDDEGVLSYRQKIMSSLGASMGSIGDMLKYRLPYDSKHIATHANNVSSISKLIADAFEKEATAGKTEAKPEIWREWDKFTRAADALGQAAAGLAKAAQTGEKGPLMPQVKAVGDACKACHDPYRKPE